MSEAVLKQRKRFNFRGSLCIPYGVFMALFVIFPLLLILYYAFTDENGKFSFGNWGRVFSSPENWKVIGATFMIAAITTIVCILIAYPIAYLLSNKKYNSNKVLVYIFLLPMWINFVIRTIGLKALVNAFFKVFIGADLTATYPYVAIIIGMVYDYLPFAILPLYNQMLKMDKNQIEAAADLGANPFQVFTKTIIPMTIPGIVSACMMTFMPTMSSYVIANKMSENSTKIIGNIIEFWFGQSTSPISNHVGSALSLVMLMIIGVTLLIEKSLSGKEDTKKGGIW
ncbi:MAG: ABC transporter permease [Bacilli bacterium]|nr:ABC transporter permease [Bacilli bacterium]